MFTRLVKSAKPVQVGYYNMEGSNTHKRANVVNVKEHIIEVREYIMVVWD